MRTRSLACLTTLALAACDASSTSNGADATARTGGDPIAAYLAPLTTASQDTCFDPVALGGVATEGPASDPFAATAATRVVIAIDGSGSMAGQVGGRTKLALARTAALAFVDGLPPDVSTSLLVFGQQGDNSAAGKVKSCAGIDLLVPPTKDRAALTAAVGKVGAVGWTPLAAALERAEGQLAAGAETRGQVIYVVSDGNETCGGDPVAVAQRINRGSARAIVNIIGFDLPRADVAALQAVATAGGGKLVNVSGAGEFDRLLDGIRDSNRRMMNRVRASGARDGNLIRTGAGVTSATICTGNIITNETLAVGADLTKREARGEQVLPRGQVFAALEQRHRVLRARLEDYRKAVAGERDTANDSINAQAAAAD